MCWTTNLKKKCSKCEEKKKYFGAFLMLHEKINIIFTSVLLGSTANPSVVLT